MPYDYWMMSQVTSSVSSIIPGQQIKISTLKKVKKRQNKVHATWKMIYKKPSGYWKHSMEMLRDWKPSIYTSEKLDIFAKSLWNTGFHFSFICRDTYGVCEHPISSNRKK